MELIVKYQLSFAPNEKESGPHQELPMSFPCQQDHSSLDRTGHSARRQERSDNILNITIIHQRPDYLDNQPNYEKGGQAETWSFTLLPSGASPTSRDIFPLSQPPCKGKQWVLKSQSAQGLDDNQITNQSQ